jgi:hypothetical protein
LGAPGSLNFVLAAAGLALLGLLLLVRRGVMPQRLQE